MRVLHFFKTYLPDSFTGIERVIYEIAEGVAADGIETDVLSLSAAPGRAAVPVGHHLAHKAKLDLHIASTGLSLSVFGAFRRLAQNADLIHYHFPWPLMDVVHFATGLKKPSLVTYHSDVVRQRLLGFAYRPLMHVFLGSVDHIVATSPNYAASSPVLRRYADKLSVIPIGLDEAAVQQPTDEQRTAWRQRLGERFFLFVGALRYYKGLPFLIEAARQTGLPVVIVGVGEMQAEIEAAGLPNVTLVGAVGDRDKQALLDLCTAFVFPSHLRSEAFGIALLEAAMAGKPMISCEIGTGTSFVNVDGETGLVVPPSDPLAFAAAMRRIWDDPALADGMGRRARLRYESLFTAARMTKAYAGLYRRLLPPASSHP